MSPADDVALLRERVAQLEGALGKGLAWPPEWGLTPSLATILGVLVTRELATNEALLVALYGDRDDWPDERILMQFVFRLRRKLEAVDPKIRIHTRKGAGRYLNRRDRTVLRAFAAAQAG